ncbi:hypothetical protein N7522_008557 [Penicillium canescens]|uniref:Sialidase n=1 Tax=Penicillium canescens TaxID=5083 RepID=A0AAD6IE80_PENCN|nr:uncharacterized protein N7446_002481 [Penicillium canescens]KAJ5996897.1 hypothetical protein N7522_008557 [Penicillium canescens]KAJ6044285.1 hypothetical protein N7460_005640 [Penicillium canescens]KAJ6055754.1 hypothetical protein N7444_004852 [Penicillium canescens]KAJ6074704.1 hypothetical protein N7446_002481 [Penicillium canescens]
MSVQYARYRPTTPPRLPLEGSTGSGHSRHESNSSVYSSESSPWSTITGNTSPTTSPTRHHHGPALLPKIRPQDVVIEPVSAGGPLRSRRVLSNTRNPPGFVPYTTTRSNRHIRDVVDRLTLASPISPAPMAHGTCSTLSSPVAITPSHKRKAVGGHSRSVSASGVDTATLTRFGYPTYRELPKYVPQMHAQTTPTTPVTPITPTIVVYPSYSQRPAAQQTPTCAHPLTVPTPQYKFHPASAQPSPALLSPQEPPTPHSTTLLSYLTMPIPPINLVRNVSVVPTRGMHDYFWWDIRNLRNWTSFSLATFDLVDSRLIQLLKTEIPAELTPPVAVSFAHLAPESEPALVNMITNLYAPRVNAALAVSQGPDHLQLYAAPDVRSTGHKNHGHPHFLANYASDTEQTSAGLPRGRLVGIVKSFDRWNTGMRNEAPHRRVEYLNGLAHLQRCMREHSCRYGFIITEIELVCVRAGCDDGDDVPYFGYFEIAATIPLKTAAFNPRTHAHAHAHTLSRDGPALATPISARSFSSSSPSSSSPSSSHSHFPDETSEEDQALSTPMTASLALYFLLMLSKSQPLPHQPSAHLNVGGPGAMTRQRVLPEGKDDWIPPPQIGERRDAKRVRGWVWPQDAWHRREGGGAPRARVGEGKKLKKWHK